MTLELSNQISLMRREVAALRRDWSLFERVFVRLDQDDAREGELEAIRSQCPAFAHHLSNSLQDLVFLRLCKLSDLASDAVSFRCVLSQLGEATKQQPRLMKQELRFRKRVNDRFRPLRDERIAHSLRTQRADHEYDIKIRQTQRLVQCAALLGERIARFCPVEARMKYVFDGDDGKSGQEFVEMACRAFRNQSLQRGFVLA